MTQPIRGGASRPACGSRDTAFLERYGFERGDVTLANWREWPFSRFSFSHVGEIVPSVAVPASGRPSEVVVRLQDGYFDRTVLLSERRERLADFLDRSDTDLFLVWQDGALIAESISPHADRDRPHLAFSVTKSVTGILAGILEYRGLLDCGRNAAFYEPRLAGSGFADCTVRNLLDMRVSLTFSEEYLSADGDYARYRQATAWNPPSADAPQETLLEFLSSLPKGPGPHGGPFRYVSPVSDVLGVIVERAGGASYAALLDELLFQPMGAALPAEMTVDREGTPRGAGGLSLAARDLLRIGILLLQEGAISNRQVIPPAWIADMRRNGDDAAWASGNFDTFVVRGRYRSQWYQLPRTEDSFFAVGIHGQWLFVDVPSRTVIVRMSSQPIPQDDILDGQTLEVFSQIATWK